MKNRQHRPLGQAFLAKRPLNDSHDPSFESFVLTEFWTEVGNPACFFGEAEPSQSMHSSDPLR